MSHVEKGFNSLSHVEKEGFNSLSHVEKKGPIQWIIVFEKFNSWSQNYKKIQCLESSVFSKRKNSLNHIQKKKFICLSQITKKSSILWVTFNKKSSISLGHNEKKLSS